jgi:hypothetical protein
VGIAIIDTSARHRRDPTHPTAAAHKAYHSSSSSRDTTPDAILSFEPDPKAFEGAEDFEGEEGEFAAVDDDGDESSSSDDSPSSSHSSSHTSQEDLLLHAFDAEQESEQQQQQQRQHHKHHPHRKQQQNGMAWVLGRRSANKQQQKEGKGAGGLGAQAAVGAAWVEKRIKPLLAAIKAKAPALGRGGGRNKKYTRQEVEEIVRVLSSELKAKHGDADMDSTFPIAGGSDTTPSVEEGTLSPPRLDGHHRGAHSHAVRTHKHATAKEPAAAAAAAAAADSEAYQTADTYTDSPLGPLAGDSSSSSTHDSKVVKQEQQQHTKRPKYNMASGTTPSSAADSSSSNSGEAVHQSHKGSPARKAAHATGHTASKKVTKIRRAPGHVSLAAKDGTTGAKKVHKAKVHAGAASAGAAKRTHRTSHAKKAAQPLDAAEVRFWCDSASGNTALVVQWCGGQPTDCWF